MAMPPQNSGDRKHRGRSYTIMNGGHYTIVQSRRMQKYGEHAVFLLIVQHQMLTKTIAPFHSIPHPT